MSIELDNQDLRVIAKLNAMALSLKPFIGVVADQYTLDKIQEIIEEHRIDFKKQHGYDFPVLTLFFLPSIKFVVFYRRELSDQEIQGKLVMLLRSFAGRGIKVSAVEIAAAVQRAWPQYRPPMEIIREDPKVKPLFS